MIHLSSDNHRPIVELHRLWTTSVVIRSTSFVQDPHPAPPPSASLASALLSPSSPLFVQSAKPDPTSDLLSTHPADPTVVETDAKSTSADNALAAALARTLEVPLGVKLEKASLRWSGWEGATSFAGSDAAPEGGYEALVAKMFDEASSRGAQVRLNSVVTSVRLDEGSVRISTKDGGSYSAKTAICTIPLGVLKTLPESTFEPVLPPRMQEAIQGTHVGVLEKLVLHYPTAWWPNAQTVGSYTFLPTSTTAPTESSSPKEILAASTLVSANSFCPTLPNPHATLLTYFSETPARLLLRHSPEIVAKAFHQFLISRFAPSTPPPAPIEYELTNWLTDPFSYGATTTPSIISENGERSPMDFKELSRPVWDGRLGFAGEHTEMEHRGSVAGAVVSGQREAERVARYLSRMEEVEK